MTTQGQGRQLLNTYLQKKGIPDRPDYEESVVGEPHIPTWRAVAKMGTIICGTGTGNSKGAARDAAALKTLRNFEAAEGSSTQPVHRELRRYLQSALMSQSTATVSGVQLSMGQATSRSGPAAAVSYSPVIPRRASPPPIASPPSIPVSPEYASRQTSVATSIGSVDDRTPLLSRRPQQPDVAPPAPRTPPPPPDPLSSRGLEIAAPQTQTPSSSPSSSGTPSRSSVQTDTSRPSPPPSPPSSPGGPVPVEKFNLTVFLDPDHRETIEIIEGWDDEEILKNLKSTYDEMRGLWRRRLSAKRLSAVWLVKYAPAYWCEKSTHHPELPEPFNIPAYMRTPDRGRGTDGLRRYLAAICRATNEQLGVNREGADYRLGLKFVESWQLLPMLLACLVVMLSTLGFAIGYYKVYGDASTAFTIASYMAALIAMVLALVQVVISLGS